jgi:hypothetical protein
MPARSPREQLARNQLALALIARRHALRRVIAAELAIWAPLVHRRQAELAAAQQQDETNG